MKGVFDAKPGSQYDDDLPRRYHFPNSPYLETALQLVGDWVVYREPRRNQGRQAYVALARVRSVEPDPSSSKHSYAYVDEFERFPRDVPFSNDGRYWEAALRELESASSAGRTLQGKSVRGISEADFAEILAYAYSEILEPANAYRLGLDFPAADFEPAFGGFAEQVDRPVQQIVLNRKVRDAAFRSQVLDAYDSRCAVTGLRIINGGERAEVEAAHIRPVEFGGPDVVQNGIALSKTVHWLFDRHLITIGDDYRLRVAHNRVPTELQILFPQHGKTIHLPQEPHLRPAPIYLAYHRERFAAAH